MSLAVVANKEQLASAINSFSTEYHNGYRKVRELSASYLSDPTLADTTLLAKELSKVLYRWGAGKRGAPAVRDIPTLQATLVKKEVHALLASFASLPITTLAISDMGSRLICGIDTAARRRSFDENLCSVLSQLSNGILVGNTNVTYPTKALLLLTGFMPALDSQVRKGLGKAGFSGTNLTQFLLPAGILSKESAKLTRLPFYLAECYLANFDLLTGAATASHHPWLASEPGRLFDVLLFIQGGLEQPLFLLTPTTRRWYDLT